ncbi:MAG: putative membrane protein [Flavobacteriales bacterium]|jgi:putative membrane protein
MPYEYIKALHIIFVITWFAGLFYIVRLFIYHAEAEKKPEPDRTILQTQYKLMEWRLWYIITWPSSILALVFGCTLFYLNPGLLLVPAMQLKLVFVAGLFCYQLVCQRILSNFRKGEVNWSSMKLRMWNEVATLFLFAIVFLVVLKDMLSWVYGLVGLIALAAMMMLGIKIYRKLRAGKGGDSEV